MTHADRKRQERAMRQTPKPAVGLYRLLTPEQQRKAVEGCPEPEMLVNTDDNQPS